MNGSMAGVHENLINEPLKLNLLQQEVLSLPFQVGIIHTSRLKNGRQLN
jgi:hypothetical protein